MKLVKLAILMVFALLAFACNDSGAGNGGPDGDSLGVCTSDKDCPEGEQCYLLTNTCEVFCFDNTDCPDEKVCTSEGICGNASVCLSDDDCQAGETCVWDDAYNSKVCKILIDGDTDYADGDNSGEDGDDSDGDQNIENKCPVINVKPGSVNFGAVYLGESASGHFTITNDSNNNVPLIIYDIHYDSLEYTPEFVMDPDEELDELPFSIQRGQSVVVNFEYTPSDGGIDTGRVEITSNACGGGYVEVELKSVYKGTALIDVAPKSRDFGNVNLGETAIQQEFNICNTGDLDGNKVLTVTQIAAASGVWDNFKCISSTCVTPQVPPLTILPGEQNCQSFVVEYRPQSLAETWDPHRDTIMIFNDADSVGDRIYKIDVSGSAESSSLFIHPYPIDFGTVAIGTSRERIATLHNYAPTDITLNLISMADLSGDNCDMFTFGEDLDAIQGTVLPANNTQPAAFTVIYTPTEKASHTCHIDVASSLDGSPHMQFPMQGKGKPANKAPECLVSLESHGRPIDMVIEDIPADIDTTWKFYGNITNDPDAEDPTKPIKTYTWSTLVWPTGSETYLHTFGEGGMNVYTQFDVPGTYKFQLQATDKEGLECEEPFVVEIHARGDQGLSLIMDFTPGSPIITTYTIVDCDLGLRHQVSGQVCDDEHANSYGTCYTMQHAICNMPKISQGAAGSGTREEINCSWLEDGNWVIEAELEEDCSSNSDWQTLVKCWGTHDPTVTIKMYDPNTYSYDPLFPPISTVLTYKGDTATWFMRKNNGLWMAAPVEI